MHIYMCVYIYVREIEREGGRERESEWEREYMCVHVYVYTQVHADDGIKTSVYVYTFPYMCSGYTYVSLLLASNMEKKRSGE
jgi:hypothetical protein